MQQYKTQNLSSPRSVSVANGAVYAAQRIDEPESFIQPRRTVLEVAYQRGRGGACVQGHRER